MQQLSRMRIKRYAQSLTLYKIFLMQHIHYYCVMSKAEGQEVFFLLIESMASKLYYLFYMCHQGLPIFAELLKTANIILKQKRHSLEY